MHRIVAGAPGLGARPPRLPALRRVPGRDVRGRLHEHLLRLPACVHPARALRGARPTSAATTPATRSRTSGSRRGCSVVGDLRRGWYELALRIHRATSRPTCTPGRPAARRARVRPRARAVPAALPRAAAVRRRRARLRPHGPATRAWLAFAVSVVLAVVVSFGFRFLYNLSAFWLLDYRGPVLLDDRRRTSLLRDVIPLAFFPDWLETIATRRRSRRWCSADRRLPR